MIEVVLLLGGNVGDSEQIFGGVRRDIAQCVGGIVEQSQILLTEAWGFESAPFSNQALVVSTSLEPIELLDELQAIERKWGRDREGECENKKMSGERYTARTIDIDIIFYGDRVIESERLTIPHLLMTKRRFVLEPIAQVAPHLVHPKCGKSIEELLKELKD